MFEGERGKFISIHGIDGTGKSSSAVEISEKLNEANVPTINYDAYKEGKTNPYAEKKIEIKKTGILEDQLAVYLESMMFHSDEIENLLNQGFHVVKSRYLDDIKAHFGHLGVSDEKIEELTKKFPMVQPDLKVILFLDENQRRQRLENRGVLNNRDEEAKAPGSRLKYFEDSLLKASQNAIPGSVLHVNTGELNVDEVAKKIIDHILNN